MRRDTFLKSLAALAAAGALPSVAWANANIKMMIPANPGGGWDSTGRALGKALQDAGAASSVTFENKGGAAGAIGLAQFFNASKGDPNALMVMGAVMLGGIITGKPPVSVTQLTPIARLTTEYNVFVLPADSPFKTMKDVVEQLKKDPGSVKWGGGSRGSTEHIAAAQIAQAVGVQPSKINYVPFRGGGEATAAILGGNVTVGGSGYSEFQQYIESGKMRPIAVTSGQRLSGHQHPHAERAGHRCRDRQLARRVWRCRHHPGRARCTDGPGGQGDQERGLGRSPDQEQLDRRAAHRQGLRRLRGPRLLRPARDHGARRHGLTLLLRRSEPACLWPPPINMTHPPERPQRRAGLLHGDPT